MKKRILLPLSILFVLSISVLFMSASPPQQDVFNFPSTESVKYIAHYGFINAGEAVITLDKNKHLIHGRSCHKVTVEGKTIGLFGLTMKVEDVWESYIDVTKRIPLRFHRNIRENNYRKVETIDFLYHKKIADVHWKTNSKPEKNKQYVIPEQVQDMVSGYYFLRNINFNSLKVGEIIHMDAFFEDKMYDFQVKYNGKVAIKTDVGKFNAIEISPIMPDNSLFDGENAIRMWISDDAYRVPLKVKAKMFIGSLELDIKEYKNDKVHWED